MTANAYIPLPLAPDNTLLHVKQITAATQTSKKLASLGITINTTLQITQHIDQNLILAIGNTRLALNQAIAQKIIVSQGETTHA